MLGNMCANVEKYASDPCPIHKAILSNKAGKSTVYNVKGLCTLPGISIWRERAASLITVSAI